MSTFKPRDFSTVRIFIWTGPLLTLLFFIGLIPLMGFIPPMLPSDSPAQVADFYIANQDMIRLGTVFLMVAVGLFTTFGIALSTMLRGSEGLHTPLTHLQLSCLSIGTVVGVLIAVFWGCAAYRPSEISPDMVITLNDLGWFMFLFDWPPFVIWFFVVGAAILLDKRPVPAFPRWTAYLSIWAGILSLPAGLMIFFKHGPFAYDGLIAMYIPLTVFFVWIVSLSSTGLKTLRTWEQSGIAAATVPAASPIA